MQNQSASTQTPARKHTLMDKLKTAETRHVRATLILPFFLMFQCTESEQLQCEARADLAKMRRQHSSERESLWNEITRLTGHMQVSSFVSVSLNLSLFVS
jgi:hypothetical protein